MFTPGLKFACEVKWLPMANDAMCRGLATIRGILSHLRNMVGSARIVLAPVALEFFQKEHREGIIVRHVLVRAEVSNDPIFQGFPVHIFRSTLDSVKL